MRRELSILIWENKQNKLQSMAYYVMILASNLETLFVTLWEENIEGGVLRMDKYECTICGYIYDEAEGNPDNGVAAGTKWADLPADWVCPLCGADKDSFEKM